MSKTCNCTCHCPEVTDGLPSGMCPQCDCLTKEELKKRAQDRILKNIEENPDWWGEIPEEPVIKINPIKDKEEK